MKIAIAMRTFEQNRQPADDGEAGCFAEFEVHENEHGRRDGEEPDEDVQVTVVLRGKREELEDPALGVTELVLRALETRDKRRPAPGSQDVIDVAGVCVTQ